jgi:DNA-binding NarL/FixJ family response regulator
MLRTNVEYLGCLIRAVRLLTIASFASRPAEWSRAEDRQLDRRQCDPKDQVRSMWVSRAGEWLADGTQLGAPRSRGRLRARVMKSVRLLIVSDRDVFRVALVALLSAQHDFEVSGQASSSCAGVRLAREIKPEVVLMDIGMADLGGCDAARAIREDHASTRVLMLTAVRNPAEVAAALEAGASGLLAKDTPASGIVAAVRAAAEGAAWLSPGGAEGILSRLRQSDREPVCDLAPAELLSRRELEVLRLIASGMEDVEIAEALDISPETAQNRISEIVGRFVVRDRPEPAERVFMSD